MTQINNKQWKSILEIIHATNAHLEDFNSFRRQVLKALQQTIRADFFNFFLFDHTRRPSSPMALNIEEKYLRLYQDYFFQYNPFDPVHGWATRDLAVKDNSVMTFSDFKKSYIYKEFLKTHNAHRQLLLYLKSDQKILGFVGLLRGDEKSPFNNKELAMAEAVAPLLSQSLEKARIFQKAKSEQVSFQTILNRAAVGILTLSYDLQPLFKNETAKALFARMKRNGMDFKYSRDNSACFPRIALEACRELKNRMSHFSGSPIIQTKLNKTIRLSDNEILRLTAEFLDNPAMGSPTPFFLISFDKETGEGQINEHKLKNEKGLSRREIELVHYLFKGLKNHEIADIMYISEGTVKNHLRNIFDKMGVATRTSLIYEILSL